MKIKLLTTLSMATLLLFTACGDSDDDSKNTSQTTELKKKEFIVIGINIVSEQCTLSRTKDNINGSVFLDTITFNQNIDKSTLVVSLEQSNVSCTKYDRSNDDISCSTLDFQRDTAKSCVAGFDFEK